MFEALENIEKRFEEIEAQLQDPEVLSDHKRYTALAIERAGIQALVSTNKTLRGARADLQGMKELLQDKDPEIKALAKEEIEGLQKQIPDLEQQLRVLLMPSDPLDERNILLEIRAGTGGDEASLFVGDLFLMYSRFANLQKWSVEVLSHHSGNIGGYKEIIALIKGDRVYSQLRYEMGVHRVQRVPITEKQGRIQTSACTVAILPEADEIDCEINLQDVRVDTYRASGAGGQHVNRTDSAVRLTHMPSGLVVTSQDERSQHRNKARAMQILRSRLLDLKQTQQNEERTSARRGMVGSGDRSERIRTYNFPQNRITDHRINLTLHNLDQTLSTGQLNELVNALRSRHQADILQKESL